LEVDAYGVLGVAMTSSDKNSLFDLVELKKLGGFKAGDLLAVDSKIYDKFMKDLSKTVKRDETTKNITFLTGISTYTPEPINLFLRGESSIGKTYNVVQAMKYFPREDVWLLGGLSPTALIHQHGILVDENGEVILPGDKPGKEASVEEKEAWHARLKDSYYLVDLKGKILVFLEAPSYETFNMLRPILSHDAQEISYRFTDKSGKGQLQTQHVVIRGWPATIFCSTKEKYVQDLATRGFSHTPESTEMKYQEANVLTGRRAAFPWKFERDFNFMLLEAYIRFLRNNLEHVWIAVPYAEYFAQKFPSKFPRSMRDFKHVLNLMKIHALFHFAQRPIFIRKVKPEILGDDPSVSEEKEIQEQYVMATKRDYDVVIALWDKIRETTETSAPGHIMKLYHDVVEDVAKRGEFSIEDLTDGWNLKFENKKSSDAIRKMAEFLCDAGYLTSRIDRDNKKRKLYKIIHENEKSRSLLILPFATIFTLDSFKAWLNEVNSITASGDLLFKENLVSERETSCEDIFNRYFSSERVSDAVIDSSDSKGSLSESDKEIVAFQKINNKRNFLQSNGEGEKDPGQQSSSRDIIRLEDVKLPFWDPDSPFAEHECGVCGYTKMTSWQAETFKGQVLWICEDCKLEWEKRQGAT
jgi:hypothetical protein